MSSYVTADIKTALRGVGLEPGDTVYVISALWRLPGLIDQDPMSDQSAIFYEVLRDVVGDAGTIVVPTTTHNLCNTDVPFDPEVTPSFERGLFTEYVRKLPETKRSFHPFASYGAVGPRAAMITESVSRHAFGPMTPESRMIDAGAKFLALGVGPNIIPTVHHVEHVVGVPYRYHKEFFHPVVRSGVVTREAFYQFVWYRNSDVMRSQNRHLFEKIKGRLDIRYASLGRGQLSSFSLARFFELSVLEFVNDIYVWCDHPPTIRPYQT